MQEGAATAADRIDRVRVELRLSAVFRVVRRFVAPAKSEIERDIGEGLEVVLDIKRMRPPPRQPGRDRLGELRIADRAEQEGRERVPGIRPERKIGGAETIRARGQRGRQRVVAGTDDLVAEFQRVLVDDLGQVVLEREVFAHILRSGETAVVLTEEGCSAGTVRLVVAGLKVRKGRRADIGYAELLGPVLV